MDSNAQAQLNWSTWLAVGALAGTLCCVTAVTAEKLDQQNLVTFTDLDSKVPDLVLTRAQGFERAVSIRGLGKEAQQNGNALPSVAVHQDGVFMPSAVALNADYAPPRQFIARVGYKC